MTAAVNTVASTMVQIRRFVLVYLAYVYTNT